MSDYGKSSGGGGGSGGPISFITVFVVSSLAVIIGLQAATYNTVSNIDDKVTTPEPPTPEPDFAGRRSSLTITKNPCEGTKPEKMINGTGVLIEGKQGVPGLGDYNFSNRECFDAAEDDQAQVDVTAGVTAGIFGQAGADVTKGHNGEMGDQPNPIDARYLNTKLCPVNVHWHLGAEHRSEGQYDEDGSGPTGKVLHRRRLAGGDVRQGHQCHHYNKDDAKFTTEYKWKFCKNMQVGQTYEVHWPHSSLGACGTPHQYQYTFYDGVFCNLGNFLGAGGELSAQTIASNVGVQGQVFTIVNDESYYYNDLYSGMIVDGEFGKDMAVYTGSTTGTSRDNKICSMYAPITWQVDRKCHLISASSFDKMCADQMATQDNMYEDTYAHGARETVFKNLTANNQKDMNTSLFFQPPNNA